MTALLASGLAGSAAAQARASLSLESDYRVRAVSYSGGKPALSLDLAYDHPGGAYVGVSLIGRETEDVGAKLFGRVAYLGYAHQGAGGQAWDMGVKSTEFIAYDGPRRSLRYSEIYAGLSRDNLSAHIYYSPDYFVKGAHAVYGEVNDSWRFHDDWRAFAHLGALQPSVGLRRIDVRLGVARLFRDFELHAAWTATTPQPAFRSSPSGPAVIAGATLFF